MTPRQQQEALYLWYFKKSDTWSIAKHLKVEEADVYNVLSKRIKAKVAA
jgi:hypothetical protein